MNYDVFFIKHIKIAQKWEKMELVQILIIFLVNLQVLAIFPCNFSVVIWKFSLLDHDLHIDDIPMRENADPGGSGSPTTALERSWCFIMSNVGPQTWQCPCGGSASGSSPPCRTGTVLKTMQQVLFGIEFFLFIIITYNSLYNTGYCNPKTKIESSLLWQEKKYR